MHNNNNYQCKIYWSKALYMFVEPNIILRLSCLLHVFVLILIDVLLHAQQQCKIYWSKALYIYVCGTQHHSQALLPSACIKKKKRLMFYYMHKIQLSFCIIVFTQYMQRCFQSKCYYISVKLCRRFAL